MGLPAGIVINRSGMGDSRTADYCRAEGIEILAEIPDSREVAEIYSRGEMIAETLPFYEDIIKELCRKVMLRANGRV
jgi:MinD superfamily P-loop ATPase